MPGAKGRRGVLKGLPLLPTTCVGSYAAPGWFAASLGLLRDGALGPEDEAELFDDAIAVCVADQLEAGVDVLCDGEFRRQRFVFELYATLGGLERLPVKRRLGVPGYDRAPRFRRTGSVSAPGGLGIVAEFEALRRCVPGRPIKIAVPGPLTFAAFIATDGAVSDLLDELVLVVRAELTGLVAAGCDYLQVDEPGLTVSPHGLSVEAGAE
ncbi:MAG: hypothetical protein WD673_05865, partial [Alphaproteobacteria bacterium]